METSEVPFITVVMPIRNEEAFIEGTLEMILLQDYPADRLEIVVADGMSTDRTESIVREVSKKHPNVRYFKNEKRRSSSGRNIGFKEGKGDLFVVIDGHCYVKGDQLLKNVARCIRESGADCLGRPQPLTPPGLSEFQQSVAMARASILGHSVNSYIYSEHSGFVSPVSAGAIYTRKVFENVGYVDENFDACEDVEFNYRVEKHNYKCYIDPTLAVHYYPRANYWGLFVQTERYGAGRARFLRKHPGAFTIETIVPALLVLTFVVLLVAGLFFVVGFFSPWLLATLAAVALGYAVALVGTSCCLGIKHGMRHLKYFPGIFLAIHFGLGIGFLRGFLKK